MKSKKYSRMQMQNQGKINYMLAITHVESVTSQSHSAIAINIVAEHIPHKF